MTNGENVTLWIFSKPFFKAYLHKGTSGLKNAHNLQHPIWTQFLHPLSHGVIHFVGSACSKNLEMEVSDWRLKNLNQYKKDDFYHPVLFESE